MLLVRIVAGVLASGALFLLALPPADLGFLGWIALAPLLWSVRGTRFVYGFGAGLLTCLFSAFLATNGVFLTKSIGDGNPQWIYTGFILFGWIVGVVAGATAEIKTLTVRNVLGVAALGVVMELVTMFILPAHLALTQYRLGPAMGLASAGGIWLVSFLLWLSNASAAALLQREWKPAAVTALSGCVALPIGYYLWVLPLTAKPEYGGLDVAMVQTESVDLSRLSEMNLSAGKQGARVAVWPELSAANVVQQGDTTPLVRLAKTSGHPSFTTTFRDTHSPLPHNTASLFSTEGESLRYFKRKPFSGERLVHLAGTDAVVVKHKDYRLGLNICFDSCYPAVMRETALLGADAILLPTQDPRSPNGVVQALHAAYTPFRAAELGIPIVRTDMSAYSMVVDATGRIVAQAGSGTEEVLVASVDFRPHGTLYKSLGDWFLYVCALVLVWVAVAYRAERAKEGLMQDVE